MPYSGEGYEILFDVLSGNLNENAFETLRHKDVFRYRVKTIKSGNFLELEITPLWNCKNEVRKAKINMTPEAMKNQNDKNAGKWITRLTNSNFGKDDLCITLTYKGIVPTEKEARRDIQNYLRRIREYRRKHGMPEIKYIYVIEFTDSTGNRKQRIHHHVLMSAMDRDIAEKLWPHGWKNSRRLQPDDYGLTAIAHYMIKQYKGTNSKRWASSRNLTKPTITPADTKLSKRRAERLTEDCEAAASVIFEKLYPGYKYNDCEVRRSNFVAGSYIYARMHRMHSPPPKKKKTGGRDRCQ